MPTRRHASLLVGVWMGGVVLATGVGVLAVDLVRDEVGDPPTQTVSARDVGRALAGGAHLAVPRQPLPPSAGPVPAAAAPPPGGAPASPTSAAQIHSGVAPARPRSSGSPVPPAVQVPSPGPPPGQEAPPPVASFQTVGGSLGVRCAGTTPQEVFATPAQGYRFGAPSISGTLLEVEFTSSESVVVAAVDCAGGTPVQQQPTTPARTEAGSVRTGSAEPRDQATPPGEDRDPSSPGPGDTCGCAAPDASPTEGRAPYAGGQAGHRSRAAA